MLVLGNLARIVRMQTILIWYVLFLTTEPLSRGKGKGKQSMYSMMKYGKIVVMSVLCIPYYDFCLSERSSNIR